MAFDGGDEAVVEDGGSTMRSDLWMPCLALGLARNISGIDLVTVSLALMARSARRVWFGS